MSRKIFLAGASGVIGRRLAPLLVNAGYEVFGTTRSEAKAAELEEAGENQSLSMYSTGRHCLW